MNKFGIILWLAGIAYIRCGEEPKPPTVKPTKPAPPPKCDGGWKKFGDKCYKKTSLAPAIECEAGWTAAQHDQMCYKGSSDLRNFIEAKDYCVKEGGTMACASTPVENAFLFNYMAEQKYLAVWIGGSLDMKDKWSWLDDSEWGMAAWVDGKAPDTKTSRCLQLHGKSASIKPNWRRYWTGENCENAKTAVVCKKKPNKVTPADLDRKLHAGKK
ncbi:unnamed protein product, partial [Mesorhabditis spiculigera]